MFSGVTRKCHQLPSCSLRLSSRLLHHHSHRSKGSHHNHSHSSSSSSSSSGRFLRWRPLTAAMAATAFSFKVSELAMAQRERSSFDDKVDESHLEREGWEMLYEESNLHVYRRRREGFPYETYEYRCQGSYTDISPKHFLAVQNDVSYRAEWDKNVVKLEMVEDDGANEQLIRWVAHYPYPMYPREYIYVRKNVVSPDGRDIVIESKALPESIVPNSGNYVRVACYESRMCVRCHKDFDSTGLDYVLTYFDNPEANIPSYAYNWIVNQAGPIFIKQVYLEARKLAHSGRHVGSSIRMKNQYGPARTNTTDEDEDTVGGTVVNEKKEEERKKRREPTSADAIPGTRLIPNEGEEGPMKRGAEREGEMEKDEKEEDNDEWKVIDDDLPNGPLPGRRIFT
ncbi:hypothetical protein PFISCL1PPCAC_1833 [Pristionchus fissidentatus]|uniref:Phosphatidylcholine transfer protein n=1 Tax=Pristionchus fissidentatus TaxID=1538716 RepID=A0AAV5UVJ7_9BILA|nr:hypothetical protein PFISCL1PPCAC_1833 [Pristionchus fissidentatus]